MNTSCNRTAERLFHYLFYYCGVSFIQKVKFHGSEIFYQDELFAYYWWDENNIPTFQFVNFCADLFQSKQDQYRNFLVRLESINKLVKNINNLGLNFKPGKLQASENKKHLC